LKTEELFFRMIRDSISSSPFVMPEYASRTRIREKKGFDDPGQFIPNREIKEDWPAVVTNRETALVIRQRKIPLPSHSALSASTGLTAAVRRAGK
jgi:hypothetical protein